MYSIVFYFEPTDNLETTEIRTENDFFRKQISRQIKAIYTSIGYKMVMVPLLTIQQRLDFIKMFIPDIKESEQNILELAMQGVDIYKIERSFFDEILKTFFIKHLNNKEFLKIYYINKIKMAK